MDERTLNHIAVRTGLGLNHMDREEKISFLLSQLWEIFGERIILKEGTALKRVYLARIGTARFSEDIDVDYFNGDMETSAGEIVGGMKNIEGINMKGPRILHRISVLSSVHGADLRKMLPVVIPWWQVSLPHWPSKRLKIESE